jgi:uncharacterized membrane protein SpoIIM required for sporulation
MNTNPFFVGIMSWCFGIIFAVILVQPSDFYPKGELHATSKSIYSILYIFLKIFLNNFIVGLCISIGGFFTGGLLTILIFIINGFIICMTVLNAIYISLGVDVFFNKLLLHGIFEITGFLYIGSVGFHGYVVFKTFQESQKIRFNKKYVLKNLLIGNLLLFIAAIIETLTLIFL